MTLLEINEVSCLNARALIRERSRESQNVKCGEIFL